MTVVRLGFVWGSVGFTLGLEIKRMGILRGFRQVYVRAGGYSNRICMGVWYGLC